MIATPRLIGLLLALALSACLIPLFDVPLWRWLVIAAVLLALVLFDLLQLRRIRLQVLRKLPRIMYQQRWTDVNLSVQQLAGPAVSVKLHDMHPEFGDTRNLPLQADLQSGEKLSLQYQFRSPIRTAMKFEAVSCRVRSALGLIENQLSLPVENQASVYPNYTALREWALVTGIQSVGMYGNRAWRQAGREGEFHQLREYRRGDGLRQIDWKASAREQTLISREFEQERDQQIVFLLDCSLRMRHQRRGTGLSHMDQVLNAVIVLAKLALQHGDSVGMMTFGGDDRWVPPSKGHQSIGFLLKSVFDLRSTSVLPDYQAAVERLSGKLNRRALVIMISTLRNEDGEAALQALQRLRRRHLVLMVDMYERDLEDMISEEPDTLDEALTWLAAIGWQQERAERHRKAIVGGSRILDVPPNRLTAKLIDQYLSIKHRGEL